jgi:hypothetical protein
MLLSANNSTTYDLKIDQIGPLGIPVLGGRCDRSQAPYAKKSLLLVDRIILKGSSEYS